MSMISLVTSCPWSCWQTRLYYPLLIEALSQSGTWDTASDYIYGDVDRLIVLFALWSCCSMHFKFARAPYLVAEDIFRYFFITFFEYGSTIAINIHIDIVWINFIINYEDLPSTRNVYATGMAFMSWVVLFSLITLLGFS